VTNTPYHIKIAPAAARQISVLSLKQKKTVLRFIEALAINPRPPGSKKVEGMVGLYGEDIEHMRLIYKVEEQEVFILLVK
jgi:mRNA interferase RelE/StbE